MDDFSVYDVPFKVYRAGRFSVSRIQIFISDILSKTPE